MLITVTLQDVEPRVYGSGAGLETATSLEDTGELYQVQFEAFSAKAISHQVGLMQMNHHKVVAYQVDGSGIAPNKSMVEAGLRAMQP